VGGWLVFHGAKRAGVARHGDQTRYYDVPKPQPPTWRGVGEKKLRPTEWDEARSALTREDNHAKTTSARVLRGRLAGSLRGEARAGRAPRKSKTVATTSRSRSGRPGEVSAKKSLGQRRGVERVARWPRKKIRQVSQRALALWAVGRSFHGAKRAGVARHGDQTRYYDVPKPQLPTWRGVGEKEHRPIAWGGARRALAAKTTTPSQPARACSVCSWSFFSLGEARAGRVPQRSNEGLRRFEVAAADLARCRRKRVSANGVGWSA